MSISKGGQSAEHANVSIALPEGVDQINLTYRSSLDGFTRSYVLKLTVTLSDGFVVVDADALLDWLARVGWSINDHKPTSVAIKFVGGSADGLNLDVAHTIAVFGLDSERVANDLKADHEVRIIASELEPVLGPWPGEAPVTPEGMFVRAP